jgi:hypothetical protein
MKHNRPVGITIVAVFATMAGRGEGWLGFTGNCWGRPSKYLAQTRQAQLSGISAATYKFRCRGDREGIESREPLRGDGSICTQQGPRLPPPLSRCARFPQPFTICAASLETGTVRGNLTRKVVPEPDVCSTATEPP